MKKVYSFKKEILFKNNIYEILSMAIDKQINLDDHAIKGQFKINGEYLIKENEQDEFNIELPYLNYIEDNYEVSKAKADIDDFYYEVKDNNRLILNIDIVIDGLEEIDIPEEKIVKEENNSEKRFLDIVEDVEAKGELIDDDGGDFTIKEDMPVMNEVITEDAKSEARKDNNFITYRICIVRDEDTIESIMSKYNVSMETLKEYNIINELKNGDKLIIPYERD